MSGRPCRCGCGADLSGLRADAVYASDSCRKRVRRAKSADKGRTRRESRNGKGTRIYLTPAEVEYLKRLNPDIRSISDLHHHHDIGAKLARASRRLP